MNVSARRAGAITLSKDAPAQNEESFARQCKRAMGEYTDGLSLGRSAGLYSLYTRTQACLGPKQ